MRQSSLLLAAIVLGAVAAHAADAPLPKAVATDLQSNAALCRDAEGKPSTKDAVTRIDLNSDGNEDFVLFVGDIQCDGAATIYGDREKGVTVYVGDGKGGATPAFSDAVYSIKVERNGAASKLWLGVSGEACGKKPAKDFASESFCDRAVVWNAAKSKFEYEPVSTVRTIE